jgi:HSP20 family protein
VAEIQYGAFERLLYLPSPIDTENVTAAYQKGLLMIRSNKIKYETRHNIPISGE